MGAIAFPNPVRWLSVPPLAGLEGQGRGFVGGGGPQGGVSHTLPPASSSVYGTHHHAFVCPYFHQRGCSRGGHPAVDCHGCCGACSSSLSRLFQPPVSDLEELWVVASGHRPVPAHSLHGHFPLSPGAHPVCSHVSPSGGLDGLRRSSGGVSSGSCASGISSLPALCGSWPHLPIQCVVLRSVHGPAGLPSGYGSCIRSSFLGYPYVSLPGRLARPGIVPGGPPPGPRGCLVPLSRVGDSGQPGVVPSLRLRWYIISGWSSTLGLLWHLHRQIVSPGCGPPPTNSVLHSASCLLVAVSSGVAVLSVTSGSRWPPADEFAHDLPSPLLASVGSFGSGAVVSGLSSGPSVVASRGSLLSRCVSPAGVPSSCLLVRRFRRRLGSSLGLLWLLHRQIASPGCGPPPMNSALRSASCLLVAVTSGVAVLSVTSGSRWPPADEFAHDLPSPLLASVGSFGSGAVVSGLSSGPSVVASRGSLLSRCVSPAGVPSSCLLVRRFRRRLGSSLGLLWLLHRQIASPGCGPPPMNSALRSASCLLVAVTSGVAVLSVTSGSRWPPADEFGHDLPSLLLGSVGSFGSGAVVSGLSSGPSVVALRGSLLSRCVSPAGVPSSCLLVRRFRRRLGASLG